MWGSVFGLKSSSFLLVAPEQLEDHVIKQVEYYFSLENLAKDHYLVSLMNPGGYVPLRVVHGFKLVQQLTNDFDFFVASLRKSKNLVIDDAAQTIKTGFRPQRLTVILRDLPQGTTEAVNFSLFVCLLLCSTPMGRALEEMQRI
jgi:la-related protein 4